MQYKLGKKFLHFIVSAIILFFCVDNRSNCVKNVSVLSFLLKTFPHFLTKKLYALVWIQLETRTDFNKTKILNKYFA